VRISDHWIFDQAATRSGAAREKVDIAVAETSSGLRVRHPGDDPAAAGMVVQRRLAEKRWGALAEAAGRSSDELSASDNALGGIADALSRAREIAVQMSNSTYNATERAAAGQEIGGLLRTSIALLNTRVGNRYVFGGRRDEVAPFDAAGAYLGDNGARQVEIAPGVLQDASVHADVIIKGTGGGVDVLTELQNLQAALQANDITGVQGTLDGLDTSINQVAHGRAQLGTAMNMFDTAKSAARTAGNTETTAVSHLADADVIESASRLALAQRALDASLTASARSFDLTLLDKLGR
jgi:flagellar hook-associated protein 3 FlgL